MPASRRLRVSICLKLTSGASMAFLETDGARPQAGRAGWCLRSASADEEVGSQLLAYGQRGKQDQADRDGGPPPQGRPCHDYSQPTGRSRPYSAAQDQEGSRDDREDAQRVVAPGERKLASHRVARGAGSATQRVHHPDVVQRAVQVQWWKAEERQRRRGNQRRARECAEPLGTVRGLPRPSQQGATGERGCAAACRCQRGMPPPRAPCQPTYESRP